MTFFRPTQPPKIYRLGDTHKFKTSILVQPLFIKNNPKDVPNFGANFRPRDSKFKNIKGESSQTQSYTKRANSFFKPKKQRSISFSLVLIFYSRLRYWMCQGEQNCDEEPPTSLASLSSATRHVELIGIKNLRCRIYHIHTQCNSY